MDEKLSKEKIDYRRSERRKWAARTFIKVDGEYIKCL